MNTKKHILSLLVGTVLTAGCMTSAWATVATDGKHYDKNGYDSQGKDRKGYDRNGYDSQGKDKHGNPKPHYDSTHATSHSPDSDLRGYGDSKNNKAKQKVTVCHVPKGNPANRHTIHISISAWPAHRDNHGGDFLGSCNTEIKKTTKVSKTDSTTGTTKSVAVTSSNLAPPAVPEAVHTISGCTGEARTNLISKLQSYYEPIVVDDTALDDPAVVAATSQCLNNGDSSDSGRGGHNDSDSEKNKAKEKADSNKKKSDSTKKKDQGKSRD